MRQQPVLARLDGLGFRMTGGALEYAGLRQVPPQLPAAFFVQQGESAADNRFGTGAIDQRVTVSFAVMLVLAPVARRDGAVNEQLQDLGGATIDRLLGWQHPDCSGPTLYAGGDLAGVDASAFVWALRFRAPYHLRKVS